MANLTGPHTDASPSPAPQARLRGNIANPSSPELLHFLFGPLHVVRLPPNPQVPPAAEGIRVPLLERLMARPLLPPGRLWTCRAAPSSRVTCGGHI